MSDRMDDDDWVACEHEHDEDCYDYQDFFDCRHQHCWNCGECGCAGYCDDYQTYNLRPAETGGRTILPDADPAAAERAPGAFPVTVLEPDPPRPQADDSEETGRG